MSRPTLTNYLEAIKRLCPDDVPGIALDRTCSHCGYPEMSGRVLWPEGRPLGVAVCRQCGHAEVAS
jgi:hypothetical protein